jgi:hypothetical protein
MISPMTGKNNIANRTIIANSVLLPLLMLSRYAHTHKTMCIKNNAQDIKKNNNKIPELNAKPTLLLKCKPPSSNY